MSKQLEKGKVVIDEKRKINNLDEESLKKQKDLLIKKSKRLFVKWSK